MIAHASESVLLQQCSSETPNTALNSCSISYVPHTQMSIYLPATPAEFVSWTQSIWLPSQAVLWTTEAD